MHSSGRDSGYCENANSDLCDVASQVAAGPDYSPYYPNAGGAGRRATTVGSGLAAADDRDDVHLILSSDEKVKDCRITGSSCRALKHAVSNLTRLDDFVCEKIGDGFFSEVYKVTHQVTGRVMVLKMNLLRSNRANMLKEVQLMNRLSHPNILKFMGVCVHEGQLHALTEYINGGSLEQLIQSSQELTYSVRMKLALDIAKGMQYLHSQDFIHRDLTSKNVLIKKAEDCEEMTAVVADFGLAAKIPRPGHRRLPTVGSPWWMSPECLKGKCYDERSDIFSYGIVLCELIARVDADPDVLPRTSNFGLDYLAFVEMCSQLPVPPPPEFLKLAFSCCNLEPKNRPSFGELVKILDKIVASYSNGHYLLSGCTLTEAKSEELLPCPSPSPSTPSEQKNSHKKLTHRRSLSEDIGIIVFPSANSPSDKARCHQIPQQQSALCHPPLKHVGECMYHEDPHYKPNSRKSNPFASLSKFRGVKKVLAQTNSTDLFSSCFELPSPFYGADDCKPSFYAAETDCSPKPSSAAASLPYSGAQSCGGRLSSNENRSSSIFVEPVVKPSKFIERSSDTFNLESSSKETPVTPSSKPTKGGPVVTEAAWKSSATVSPSSVSSSSSSSSPSSSCNSSSVTLKVKNEKKPKASRASAHLENYKAMSLPSSPTFMRRRAMLVNGGNCFSACKSHDVDALSSGSSGLFTAGSKKIGSPAFLYPLYKSRGCLTEVLLADAAKYGNLLRSCSSSSNIAALEECSNSVFLPTTETPPLNLKRRGSCESGFYSSVGDDFCVPGMDVCVGHHHHHHRTASSFTLSSSSAASSLFLDSNSEDNSTPIFFSGRYPCTIHHHHYHTASSIYTDSSEDVSSLASSETPVWDDKQKPQHISKIVEYFERKQGGNGTSTISHKLDFLDSPNRFSSFPASVRRNWLQSDTQSITRSSLDYYTRRKLFEKPFTGGSHVLSKRSTNQRLLICEGAVKSKLPIFDKK